MKDKTGVTEGSIGSSSDVDPWFVTGFSDGEAAFTFSRSGNAFSLYFSITQREDNRDILDKIQKYFGSIGKIYWRKEQLPKKNSGHTRPNVYFRVCRQSELPRIIEHFDKFPLQSKKREAYNVWKEMVQYKLEYFINCTDDKFKIFSEKLSGLNQKSRAFKKRIK